MGTSYYSSSCGPFLHMSYRPLLWTMHNVAVVLDLPSNHLGDKEKLYPHSHPICRCSHDLILYLLLLATFPPLPPLVTHFPLENRLPCFFAFRNIIWIFFLVVYRGRSRYHILGCFVDVVFFGSPEKYSQHLDVANYGHLFLIQNSTSTHTSSLNYYVNIH